MSGSTSSTDNDRQLPQKSFRLTHDQFLALTDLPPETEWFANIVNSNTRRAYMYDIQGFLRFIGVSQPNLLQLVARTHVIAWRDSLLLMNLSPATISRRLSALASLFDYLCDKNAVTHNPVDGVKRPSVDYTGKSPALSEVQVKGLLEAPDTHTLKGKRDRAILATLLYHALRRNELCLLKISDMQLNSGHWYFRVTGKGDKTRLLLVHPVAIDIINDYLDAAGHAEDHTAPLFLPLQGKSGRPLNKPLSPNAIYERIVLPYAKKAGVYAHGVGPHALRATAATSALDNGADIGVVQEWLGHANIQTTKRYDRRQLKPENSPALKIKY